MLPFFKTILPDVDKLQTRWKQVLDPITDNTLLKGRVIDSTALTSGANTVNHLLGRQPQGWIVSDLNANVTIYRTEWSRTTLTLVASGDCRVSLYIY